MADFSETRTKSVLLFTLYVRSLTLRIPISLVAAACILLGSANAQAAESVPGRSATAATLGQSTLLGMQLSVRRGQRQGKVPSTVADCVYGLDDSSFTSVIESQLAKNLTTGEVATADQFFNSPVGNKYGKHGLMQIYASVGEKSPEPLPNFTDAEYGELEKFSRTSAGDKLMVRKVMESPEARQAIASRIQDLLNTCRAK
jgi:hypothetical protein